jgi:hypothetical protein
MGWEKKKGRESEVKKLKAQKARNGGLGVGAVFGRGEEGLGLFMECRIIYVKTFVYALILYLV